MSTRKKSLPPGPRSRVPGRVFRELRRGPLEFLTKLAREYGDIASFYAIGQRYVIINSPELAREILMGPPEVYWKGPALQNSKGLLGDGLLTAEGETHRRQRRLMQGSFHAKHVETYAGAIADSSRELIADWQKRVGSRKGEPVIDLRPDMMSLTLVIAGRALFGTLLADDVRTVHRCMDDLMNNYVRSVVPWGKLLNLLPLPSTRKLARARDDLFALVNRMIAARRGEIESQKLNIEHPADLLSMMIAATDTDQAHTRLTDDQLRDQCVTILTAGHETTANALTFTLFLLAKHPGEQAKLREEVRAVLGGAAPTVELLDRLPRTRWVLSESMRLFPPAWTMGRQNRVPVRLGGYDLPAKCTILIPQWTIHRSEKYWERPLQFLPERWRSPAHPRFAYIPFSTGPRNCIGESFAWLELMLALPMLVQAFSFAPAPGAEEIPLMPAITLRPRGAVGIRITRAV